MDVRIRNLKKSYGEKIVLKLQEMHFIKGTITGLMGDNGAGKTTLLNIICGLDRKYEGEVLLDGSFINAVTRRAVIMVRRHSYLFKRSVFENIEYPLKIRGIHKSERARQVDALINDFDLESIAFQKAHTLSGGESQKVTLARALAAQPQLLLLDETTTNIHSDAVLTIEQQIKHYHKKSRCTIIFVTHDHAQAKRLCNTNIILPKLVPQPEIGNGDNGIRTSMHWSDIGYSKSDILPEAISGN